MKIVNRPESDDDQEFGEPWMGGEGGSAGRSTDTPSKVTKKKGTSFSRQLPWTVERKTCWEAFESGPVENLRKKKAKKKKEKKANQSKPNESKAKTASQKAKVKTTSKSMKRPSATLDVNRTSEAVQEPPSPMSSFFVEDVTSK